MIFVPKSFNTPFAVILLAVLTVSFQNVNVRNKVKTIVSSSENETFLFSYDSLGRLETTEDKQRNAKSFYNYSIKDSVVIIYLATDKHSRTQKKYFLDSNGHISDSPGIICTYDREGFLIKTEQPTLLLPEIEIDSIANGDIVKIAVFSDAKLKSTTKFTFYKTIDNRDLGQHFHGRGNTHLIKTATYTDSYATIESNRTYTFDTLGRVSTETIINPKGQSIIKYTYTN